MYSTFEMFAKLEMFFKIYRQFIGNMTENLNFTYFVEEIFNIHHVTYNRRI